MTPEQKMVDEFQQKFELPRPDAYRGLDEYNGELRCTLIEEEAKEFREAWKAKDPVEMIDALCALLYVTYGAAVVMGIDLEPYFAEVHRSNLTKLGADGKPVKREDGKLLQGPNYEPPNLEALFTASLKSLDDKKAKVATDFAALPASEQALLLTTLLQVVKPPAPVLESEPTNAGAHVKFTMEVAPPLAEPEVTSAPNALEAEALEEPRAPSE